MLRKLIAVGTFLILTLSMGCTLQDPRSSPSYSVFPEILLDYDLDTDETKVWVKSALSDFKYDNILLEITIGDDTRVVQENNTYCTQITTKSPEFNLTITATSEDKIFGYQCEVMIESQEGGLLITIFEPGSDSEEEIREDDLPFKKVLDELE